MCRLQQLEPAAPKHNSRWKSKWERCTVQVQSSVHHLDGRLQGSVAATMSVGKQAPICCTSAALPLLLATTLLLLLLLLPGPPTLPLCAAGVLTFMVQMGRPHHSACTCFHQSSSRPCAQPRVMSAYPVTLCWWFDCT